MEKTPEELWFYTCKGQRFGPVPVEELQNHIAKAELDPINDLVWQNGMPSWKPLGKVKQLHIKPDGTTISLPPPPAAIPTPPIPKAQVLEPTPAQRATPQAAADVEWPGARRRSYLFMVLIFPAIWTIGYGKVSGHLGAMIPNQQIVAAIGIAAMLIPVLLALIFTLKRFANLGMSRWWIFGKFVPLLNLWVDYRLLACPAGFHIHRKMDGIGIMLAILYWLIVAISIAMIISAIIFVFTIASDPDFQQQIRDAISNNPELRNAFDELVNALKQDQQPQPAQ